MNVKAAATETVWIRAAAGLEILTGAALIVVPSFLARLLFGSGLNGVGDTVGRICGLVMVCLALGCWPRASENGSASLLAPLLALSLFATLFLVYVGMGGGSVGVLLWPAAATHLFLAILLARVWRENRRAAR